MSKVEMTGEEMFESLTGFEEIAVGQHFGSEVSELANTKPTMFLRAMVFTHLVRTGLSAKDAKAQAMGMALGDANGYFADDKDEVMPDEPVTASGKDAYDGV